MRSNVISLIKKIGFQRGEGAERAVSMALAEMASDGEIVSFYKTSRRKDKEDKVLGIDFFVIKLSGEKTSLQVKSSLAGKRTHQKKFPDVPVVVVEAEDDSENIKNKIRGVLG